MISCGRVGGGASISSSSVSCSVVGGGTDVGVGVGGTGTGTGTGEEEQEKNEEGVLSFDWIFKDEIQRVTYKTAESASFAISSST